MADYFDILKSSSPSQADLQDQRRRMNQQPAISESQITADLALAHPPIGTVRQYAGVGDTPDGIYLDCDGRVLSQLAYPLLYAVIGTRWNRGDELVGMFRIPDARGRTPIGAGQGELLADRPLGSKVGAENHTLAASETPNHTHTGRTVAYQHNHGGDDFANFTSVTGVALSGGGNFSVVTGATPQVGVTDVNTHDHGFTTDATGGGGAHNNMQPSLAFGFLIRATLV